MDRSCTPIIQFVKEADFYNRFRAGTMPLGLAPYSLYLTLYQAAPEIEGRWGVANVPAFPAGAAVAGSGTGCAIIEKSDHHEAAWEFLKWWTSAETQIRYSRNLESILGMLGRPRRLQWMLLRIWPGPQRSWRLFSGNGRRCRKFRRYRAATMLPGQWIRRSGRLSTRSPA